MSTTPRGIALTEKAYAWLALYGGLPDEALPKYSRREKPCTAPGVPLPKGVCPVCESEATVLLDGLLGLHAAPSGSGWCDGYGQQPKAVPSC